LKLGSQEIERLKSIEDSLSVELSDLKSESQENEKKLRTEVTQELENKVKISLKSKVTARFCNYRNLLKNLLIITIC
jgi:hypothetical protein